MRICGFFKCFDDLKTHYAQWAESSVIGDYITLQIGHKFILRMRHISSRVKQKDLC